MIFFSNGPVTATKSRTRHSERLLSLLCPFLWPELWEDAWAYELAAAEISLRWMEPWTSHISASCSCARWSDILENGKRGREGKDYPVFAVFAPQTRVTNVPIHHVRVALLVAVGGADRPDPTWQISN